MTHRPNRAACAVHVLDHIVEYNYIKLRGWIQRWNVLDFAQLQADFLVKAACFGVAPSFVQHRLGIIEQRDNVSLERKTDRIASATPARIQDVQRSLRKMAVQVVV